MVIIVIFVSKVVVIIIITIIIIIITQHPPSACVGPSWRILGQSVNPLIVSTPTLRSGHQ